MNWESALIGALVAWVLAWIVTRPGRRLPVSASVQMKEASVFLGEAGDAIRSRAWHSERQMEIAILSSLLFIEAARATLRAGAAEITAPPRNP